MKSIHIKDIVFVLFIIVVIGAFVYISKHSVTTTIDKQVFADHASHGCSSNHWVCM